MSFFKNVIKYYGGLPHQDQALIYLDNIFEGADRATFERIWRKHFTPFSQRDNPISPTVSCNSSAHAMLVDFMLRKTKRGSLPNDDQYVRKVYSGEYGSYGSNNSVSWDVQCRVVQSYGFNCKYDNSGKRALIDYLNEGYIAPCNFKHKGSLRHPYGGHVVVAVDFDDELGFLICDPFGSPMPTYVNKWKLFYWMKETEFDIRTQGLFTRIL